MKSLKTTQLILGVLLSVISISAHADLGKKESLKVNFNSMIEATSSEKSQIENRIGQHYASDEIDLTEDDTQKVVDFVDVEIHSGEEKAPKVVDRRYNSVGVARVEAPKKSSVLPLN